MLRIKLGPGYNQRYRELVGDDPELQERVDLLVSLFQKNPNDTRLDNHELKKPMLGKWAFSITDDIRIVYEWMSNTTVCFLNIGPHSRVYPKRPIKR